MHYMDCNGHKLKQKLQILFNLSYEIQIRLVVYSLRGGHMQHTRTHTHKARSLAAAWRSRRFSEALGAWERIRRYEPVLANPPGGGLVPHR